MPYKDKEKQKEANKLRMQKVRGNTNQGNTGQGNTEGMTWETMPLGDIISALPGDIVGYIDSVMTKYKVRSREERLRTAYRYQVWHADNFINGIHKDSKYRQYVG